MVYAAGVILWAGQPHWLTRKSLLSGFAVTLAISGVLGVLSGRWRSLLAPLLFGLTIGVISAATVLAVTGRQAPSQRRVAVLQHGFTVRDHNSLDRELEQRLEQPSQAVEIDAYPV